MTMPTFTDGVVVHQASLNALSTGINNLSTSSLGAPPPRSYVPTLRLRKTAAQTFTTAVNTLVTWDTIDVNTDSMFTLSAPSTVTIQTAGSYAVFVEYGWMANGSGGRVMWVTKNGTSTSANSIGIDEQSAWGLPTGRGNTLHIVNMLPNCIVGDTFYVTAYQNSGGNLTNVTTSFLPLCSLVSYRVGP